MVELGNKLLGSLEKGMMLYSIFQMFCMSAIFSFTYTFYIRKKQDTKSCFIFLLWVTIFPLNAIMAFSATKDVLYAGIFMICSMLYARIIECEDCLNNKIFSALFVLFSFGQMIFRNQGKYVFVFGMIFMLVAIKKYRKKLLMLSLIICVLFSLYDGPLTSMVAHKRGDSVNEMMSIPCVQLSRAVLYDDLGEEDQKLIKEYIPGYESYEMFEAISDSMKNTFNTNKFKANPTEFLNLWIKVGIQHPITYIDAAARITIGLWYPDMNYNDEKAYHPYCEWKSTGQDNPEAFEGYPLVKRNPIKGFGWLEQINNKLAYENNYQNIPIISLLFSSGIVIWMILFYVMYAIYYKKYKYLAVAAFPFALWLTLILGPVVLYRYIYPIELTVPILFTLCRNIKQDNLTI